MSYRSWNKDLIKEQMELLDRPDSSLEEVRDYDSLKSLLNSSDIEIIDIPFRRAFKIELEVLGLYNEFLKHIVKFHKNSKTFPKRALIIDQVDMSNDLILFVLNEFYTKIDRDIAKIFKNVYKERENNLIFSNNKSYAQNIPSLDYTYLSVEKDGTFNTLLNIIHEYGHAISFRMENIEPNSYYPYTELLPMLMELIASEKIGDMLRESVPEIDVEMARGVASEYQYMVRAAEDLTYLIKYLDYVDEVKFKKYVIEDLIEINNISKYKANRVLTEDSFEKMMYVPTYLVVIELYYLYKKDKEKALYLLKKLISTETKERYIPYLEKNKIYLNEHSKEFTKELLLKIQK